MLSEEGIGSAQKVKKGDNVLMVMASQAVVSALRYTEVGGGGGGCRAERLALAPSASQERGYVDKVCI